LALFPEQSGSAGTRNNKTTDTISTVPLPGHPRWARTGNECEVEGVTSIDRHKITWKRKLKRFKCEG